MDMAGSERIPVSRAEVWRALNDPEILGRCIPGCQEIAATSPTEMKAKVTLKIGPIKASFLGNVLLSEIEAPRGYRIAGEGQGGVAGYARGSARVWLEEDGEATILNYEAQANVGGKIAQLGARLIDSTARKLTGEFFANFGAILAPAAESVGEQTA